MFLILICDFGHVVRKIQCSFGFSDGAILCFVFSCCQVYQWDLFDACSGKLGCYLYEAFVTVNDGYNIGSSFARLSCCLVLPLSFDLLARD